MTSWTFLTYHARALLCIAHNPGARPRDIAASLDITERSAHGIVTDLTAAGDVVKQKDGHRNCYQIQAHLPLPEPAIREPAIGEALALLAGAGAALSVQRQHIGHHNGPAWPARAAALKGRRTGTFSGRGRFGAGQQGQDLLDGGFPPVWFWQRLQRPFFSLTT